MRSFKPGARYSHALFMKKTITLSIALTVLSLGADAATVNWAADATTPCQLQLENGTPLAQFAGLLQIGYFSTLSEATIQADFAAGNTAAIIGDFTIFASHAGNNPITGATNIGLGHWTYSDTNVTPSFAGKTIYLMAFDTGAGSTVPLVNQMGIFTGSHSAGFGTAWVFPSDNPTPGSTSLDLADVDTLAGVIVGSASGTPTFSTYQLATIPVPEPSTFALVAMAALTTAAARRRKRG